MKLNKIFAGLFFWYFLLSGFSAEAQLGGLIQKAKDKTGEIIKKKANVHSKINSSSKSTQADSLIFSEDFSKYKAGGTAGSIKSSGAATIGHPDGQRGNWLLLQNNITYKINRAIPFPRRFTFEFDIVAQAEQIKDVSPISFGFVKDNATREYISNGGTFVQLHYYDTDAVNIGNYDLNKEANTQFDLSATANHPLHVRLFITGKRIAVYLNGTKLADTTLFQPGIVRYFYISGPNKTENGARLFISNFKVYGLSK